MRRAFQVLACGMASLLPGTLRASDPPYVPTTSLLPALPLEYAPGVEACNGSTRCVDKVIREMERRWAPLDEACDHDAVFALTYLETTRGYRRAVADPEFFADNAFVNNEDRVFAGFYFVAHDAWEDGRVAEVPPAWRVAFDAADRGAVTATGNMLLGMNAHIQRDLPFVLWSIGLVAPDGASRKPDHDKVNEILNRVTEPMMAAVAERYDPTAADGDVPGTSIDAFAMNQFIQAWREGAWRNAELLAAAPDDAARRLVAQTIETEAAVMATVLRTAYTYDGVLRSAATRDAFCLGEPAPKLCTGALGLGVCLP
jgi:hypothetical protein